MASLKDIVFRNGEYSDHSPIIQVMDHWWGGRKLSDRLQELFFIHFRNTTFIAEHEGKRVGFLCGFLSQSQPDEAYIHFVGVDPDYRKLGVARSFYERFFDEARKHGRTKVRCCTSPVNRASVEFHQKLGFKLEPGNLQINGLPVHANYDGRGSDKVLFLKELA